MFLTKEMTNKLGSSVIPYMLIIFTTHVFVNLFGVDMTNLSPVILPDEMGYIAAARLFANGTSNISMFSPYYYAGYSFLLAPIMFLIENPHMQYVWGLVLNAVFISAAFFVCYKVLLYFEFDRQRSMTASFIASFYPAFIIYSNYLNGESFFVLSYLLFLYAFLLAYRNQSGASTLFFILMALTLLISHGRFLFVVVTCFVILTMRNARYQNYRVLLLNLAGTFSIYFLGKFLKTYVKSFIYTNDAQSVSIDRVIDYFFTYDGFLGFLEVAIKQFYALSAGTLFLILIAFIYIAKSYNKKTPLHLTVLLFFTIFIISALFFGQAKRLDQFYYTRYNDASIYFFIALGIYKISDIGNRDFFKVFAIGFILVLCIYWAGVRDDLLNARLSIVSFDSINSLLMLLFQSNMNIALMFLLIFFGLFLQVYFLRSSKRKAPLLILMAFLTLSLFFQGFVANPMWVAQGPVRRMVDNLDFSHIKKSCIEKNDFFMNSHLVYLLQYFNSKTHFKLVESNFDPQDCQVLITTSDQNVPSFNKFIESDEVLFFHRDDISNPIRLMPVDMEKTQFFKQDGDRQIKLLTGFSYPESNGVWTDKVIAVMGFAMGEEPFLPNEKGEIELLLRPYLEGNEYRTVDIYVNDVHQAQWIFDEIKTYRKTVTFDIKNSSRIFIKYVQHDVSEPSNGDPRLLGLSFIEGKVRKVKNGSQ